ncbi:MAG: hypothetical protein ACRDRU_29915 [Pseudonocardiaceae bacterium]
MSTGRQAARSLHRDVEAVWERLWAEFVLHDGLTERVSKAAVLRQLLAPQPAGLAAT